MAFSGYNNMILRFILVLCIFLTVMLDCRSSLRNKIVMFFFMLKYVGNLKIFRCFSLFYLTSTQLHFLFVAHAGDSNPVGPYPNPIYLA